MSTRPHRAIIVIGDEDPTGAVLHEAERYEEVFVVARAVALPSDRWVIDDDRRRSAARARLARALHRLRRRGVSASGAVGDESAALAGADAQTLFPSATILV